ncbi:DUF2971 domain-containing protein [Elizabethkingia meningoseptica]|uniref:DUF2971 domain-containing protein n=1 Tax=Elizabethkingia meningoseptica TaxID=238 RepID=UPI0023B1F17B|nr:DUF2971 domain-containing protein [Elizabethkingia meningoseptica]MDE5527938.1 DUF2971 domain-containing protein [Elizabethkingia meningoseptica]
MKVYKYRSNYQRDLTTLYLNQLYAPTYDQLNDPFEGVHNDAEDREIIKLLQRSGSNPLENAYESYLKMVKEKGIYSLCNTSDNEVLWALYADSHRGFVIEYDLDILLKDFNFNKITQLAHVVEVKYKDRPQNSMIVRDAINKSFDLSKIIGTKSTSWEKENEIRLIFEESGVNTFNFKAATSIIFGLKAKDIDIDNTMNALKGRGIQYYKVTTEAGSYKLKTTLINDLYPDAPEYSQNKAPFSEDLLSEKQLLPEYSHYKDELRKLLNNISALPNISKIDSLEIYDEKENPMVNILASTKLKVLPVRFFQYRYTDSGFIQIN